MNKIKLAIALIVFFTVNLSAQDIDSLFNAAVKWKTHTHANVIQIMGIDDHPEKCKTGLAATVKEKFDEFSPEQQRILSSLLTRPTLDTSIVTPSGKIRIHFDISGSNKPFYKFEGMNESDPNLMFVMIDSLAAAFDHSYDFEVNTMGFLSPPPDNGMGGDDLVDVYIVNQPDGITYGYTQPEDNLGNDKWSTYIVMDNDFEGSYYTEGLAAAQVTAAHELHHTIQIGRYVNRYSEDKFLYELTSTAMEDFVYTDVNDYLGYMNQSYGYFKRPHEPMNKLYVYSLAVWNIYLKERFAGESSFNGYDVILRTWELMPNYRALESIDFALNDFGYSFQSEYNNFGMWTYFTNNHAKPDLYFSEGENYPTVNKLVEYELYRDIVFGEQITLSAKPASNNFLVFSDDTKLLPDTLVSVITNGDISSALSGGTSASYYYTLYNTPSEGAVKLADGYYSLLSSVSDSFLKECNILNNYPAGEAPNRTEIEFVYPQPFNYSKHMDLHIPVTPNKDLSAELNIYNVNMNLMYSSTHEIIAGEKVFLKWNGFDNMGGKLPTGVYIYVAKSADTVNKGKLVIYNE
ncbi:MAG: hypothetical protein K9J16_08475 [Melioribacteraceae bacterium]|nr:hypothetical protein [Melioribacteraceae bacterium]MCF8353821.1 hypothetical protein [Melioribacteraceae bacterium]MCF8393657.1 hypothetical protein [Melioribacteraceae bacterium]MCF8419467.1 hypothetical protein [Melioribacteraceae bacterium]